MKKKKLKTLQLKKIVISRLDPDTSHGIKGGATAGTCMSTACDTYACNTNGCNNSDFNLCTSKDICWTQNVCPSIQNTC